MQRKVVTVLFCDVVGSTSLGESIDPEALQALLARYFDGCGRSSNGVAAPSRSSSLRLGAGVAAVWLAFGGAVAGWTMVGLFLGDQLWRLVLGQRRGVTYHEGLAKYSAALARSPTFAALTRRSAAAATDRASPRA